MLYCIVRLETTPDQHGDAYCCSLCLSTRVVETQNRSTGKFEARRTFGRLGYIIRFALPLDSRVA